MKLVEILAKKGYGPKLLKFSEEGGYRIDEFLNAKNIFSHLYEEAKDYE